MTKLVTLHDLVAAEGSGISVAADLDELPVLSDVRLKQDIAPVGALPNGLGLYSFRYVGEDETYVGVMAQEVRGVVPDAVVEGDDGYLRVLYGRLGTELMTLADWQARKQQ